MWEYMHWGSPIVIFGFVIAIVLITGVFNTMQTKARQETVRELLRSGQTLDDNTLQTLGLTEAKKEDDRRGYFVGGLITMAVAIGLVFMGYQIDKVEGDEHVLQIMIGVAAIPFMVGVALLISAAFMSGSKKSSD